MNPSPILFIYLLFITSILSPIHATQATTNDISFTEQCSVAFRRQEVGTPFDAPMLAEDSWGDFFTQGVRRVQNVLDSRQEILNDRKDKLSLMLHQVSSMGDELFAEKKMDTHWYFFLHRLMGEILTRSYEEPSLPFVHLESDFRDPTDFDGLVDTFEVQRMLRREHLTEAREVATLTGKNGYNPQETLTIDGNSFFTWNC